MNRFFYMQLILVAILKKLYFLEILEQEELNRFIMNNLMEYKGYVGSVEFSPSDESFYGKVQGIRSLISYEGTTASELVSDFHGAVDDYLSMCEAEGKEPEKAYKGSFNVRISPELHRDAAIYAIEHEITLNSFIERSIERELAMA